MSFRYVLFASSAAISLIVPVTEASAQYRYYDRPSFEHRQRQQRPTQVMRPQQADVRSAAKPAVPARKPVEQAAAQPAPAAAKPATVAPLTEEQIAAKAAVDELLAREPALVAAKLIPDPALVRAAAAKHSAQEARFAALKARQEAEAAKRREIEEKNKAREEAKAAALKARQDAQAMNGKPKFEPAKSKPAPAAVFVPQAPSAPVRPVLRMPAPEGLPLARNL
jgi:hypothetical protein